MPRKKKSKLIHLVVIGMTAYSLYRIVSDFLETETGQVVAEKASDYYEISKDYLYEQYDNLTDKLEKDGEVDAV